LLIESQLLVALLATNTCVINSQKIQAKQKQKQQQQQQREKSKTKVCRTTF
jgi:hypothetical protein